MSLSLIKLRFLVTEHLEQDQGQEQWSKIAGVGGYVAFSKNGLVKNTGQRKTLFAPSNLWTVRPNLMGPGA